MSMIRKLLLQLSIVLVSFLGFASFSPVFAQCDGSSTKAAIECGTSNASGIPVSNDPEGNINTTITEFLNILSVAVGIIAVVMIIVGGYKFMTAGGDSSKVSAAKTTVLYAIVGIIIVALSQLIIKFVLSKANGT